MSGIVVFCGLPLITPLNSKAHQPGDSETGHVEAFAAQLPPDLANALYLQFRVKDALDLQAKLCIPPCTA